MSTVTDLGVSYDNQFSFRPHIISIVSRASLRAKLILKCFVTRDSGILCKAFCAFVRPVLEFSSEIWNNILRWILIKLKTSKDASLKRKIGKTTFTNFGDATINSATCYKLLNGFIDIDSTNFLVASTNTQTRGNSCKLKKNHILNICDASMFHNRVINFWNKLPDSVVLAASI